MANKRRGNKYWKTPTPFLLSSSLGPTSLLPTSADTATKTPTPSISYFQGMGYAFWLARRLNDPPAARKVPLFVSEILFDTWVCRTEMQCTSARSSVLPRRCCFLKISSLIWLRIFLELKRCFRPNSTNRHPGRIPCWAKKLRKTSGPQYISAPHTVPKIQFKYSQIWKCAASFLIPTIMRLWVIYVFQDRSAFLAAANRKTNPGNMYKSLTVTWMWKLGETEHSNSVFEITRPHNLISRNI